MDSTDYQHDTFLCGQLFSPSCKKLQLADKIEKELGNKEETNWKLLIKLAREVEVIQNEIEDIAATKTEINMVMCLSDVLQASCLAVLIMSLFSSRHSWALDSCRRACEHFHL